VNDVDEKEAILKHLKNIAVSTKEQCIDILNNFSINTKILCFLPKDSRTDLNLEVGKEILILLIIFGENLFYGSSEEECIQFQSMLKECGCFNILLSLLNSYEDISLRLQISIILGNLYSYIVIPDEGKIIVDILINYLKEQSIRKSSEDENNKLMVSVLEALIKISTGDNEKILLDSGIIPSLLPLINSSDTNVWRKTILLLSNICFIKSAEDKNSIINYGIFDAFHKKLLEISPFPPQKMISSNYYSIYCIIGGIDNLLESNRCGVNSFLKTPLIPLLFYTLNSTI
jgi:hypothetical protein